MTIETNDGVMLIGMHSLESLVVDGDLPQLQALAARPRNQWSRWNVVTFPLNLTRAPGEMPTIDLGSDTESGQNVIPFRPWAIRADNQSRKA